MTMDFLYTNYPSNKTVCNLFLVLEGIAGNMNKPDPHAYSNQDFSVINVIHHMREQAFAIMLVH